MSLTVFIHSKKRSVALVEWFRDGKGCGDFACVPVHVLPLNEFRPAFEPRQARKVMDGSRALMIFGYPAGTLELRPMSIRKYSLVHLERYAESVTLALSSSAEAFWNAFDEAVRRAEPDEPVR